ncbi:hypothetical protein AB0953_32560 [Streptomyces sp. NPDC046866]|uniref:hypothetical protein n=1 Tax=Streptomyces sp. NPDC046866 TaxID=3154921 RepID=UPI003452CC81
MNLDVVVTVVMAVAAVMGAVFFLGRKVLKGTEVLLLELLPVIRALGRVRSAWRQTREVAPLAADREEGPRALG